MQIEQGGSAPVEVKIARAIGKTAATVEFGIRKVGGGGIFKTQCIKSFCNEHFYYIRDIS